MACNTAPPSAAAPAKAEQAAEPAVAEPPSEASPDAALQPLPSGDMLAFGSAKIMREGHADRAFELLPDGKVLLKGRPYAMLTTDGRYLNAAGTELMKLGTDGIVLAEGNPNGVLLNAGGGHLEGFELQAHLSYGEGGSLKVEATGRRAQLLGPDGPQLVSEGCEGEVRRACSLITLVYLMALGNPQEQEVEVDQAAG